jgi:hypothetical protein
MGAPGPELDPPRRIGLVVQSRERGPQQAASLTAHQHAPVGVGEPLAGGAQVRQHAAIAGIVGQFQRKPRLAFLRVATLDGERFRCLDALQRGTGELKTGPKRGTATTQ